MPKFEFVKNRDGEISIEKLSFDHSNKAQEHATDWLKKDVENKVVVIKQTQPKDVYRLIIDRIGIIKTHFQLKESEYVIDRIKIGNNHRIKDEKKTNFLNQRRIKSNNNGTDNKK